AKLATSKKKGGKTLASVRERSSESYAGNSGGNFIVPINHNGISRGIGRGHTGIDYRANVGTAVAAAADGRVIEITHGWAGGWGNSILVDHGGGWTTRYAHLSDNVVGVGNSVGQGQLIGYSGNTGRSTGPHLHFESRINGRAVQPF
ncbi:MAG: M23 family metallopeptidase, partial [Patescibacteria group bacterium]